MIILDEEKIKEKLINVRNIINNQEEISDEDALELGIIALFAQRDKAREITKEVISLYAKISRKLSKKMEITFS